MKSVVSLASLMLRFSPFCLLGSLGLFHGEKNPPLGEPAATPPILISNP